MGWRRRSYSRSTPRMAEPCLSGTHRDKLREEFKSQYPAPQCKNLVWPKLDYYDRKRSHAKQYEQLLEALMKASQNLKEFLNEPLHKNARNPFKLREELNDIEEYEKEYKEWASLRDQFVNDLWHAKERQLDDDHVARTGLCCGQNGYGAPRACRRRATNGNFCFQHISKASTYRR